MKLMDVITTYLFGHLDTDIYMKILKGIPIPNKDEKIELYIVLNLRSRYGLKQSKRMWYNHLGDFLS